MNAKDAAEIIAVVFVMIGATGWAIYLGLWLRAQTHEPEWIINDTGELGVRIGDRFYFLYKGRSLEYGGLHDDGSPMLYRPVYKREFGEVCHPPIWSGFEYFRQKEGFFQGSDWKPIGARR